MASLRKASSYSKKKARPFTRLSKNKKKAFIKVSPHNKIVKYNMGNQADYDKGKHKFVLRLISENKVQIRDSALESCRMLLNKLLDKDLPGQFYFKINIFPHHILRENKTAAGAGADRLSSGMKHSFGVIIGRAAMVKPGQDVLLVSCTNEKAAQIVKKTLSMVKAKLPCKSKIVFEKRE